METRRKEEIMSGQANQRNCMYIKWKNWGHRLCLPLYIPVHCTLRCEQGTEHLCLWGSCSAKPCLICSARHSSIHCVQAHMDTQKRTFWKSLPVQTMPAQQHLEMLWKYIWKNIFCFVLACWLCRLCQMCLLPTAKNATHDTTHKLLMTVLISSSTFLCFSKLLECPAALVFFIFCIPLLPVKSSAANDLTCLCHVTHMPRYCIHCIHWHSEL